MLSDCLYSLASFILNQPYNSNSLTINLKLIEKIKLKHYFKFLWNKKLNNTYIINDYSYTFNIIEENKNHIKISLCLYYSFINHNDNITSKSLSYYIVLAEKSKSNYKILLIAESEEDSDLYIYLKNTVLNKINISFLGTSIWNHNTNKIDSLSSIFNTYISNSIILKKNKRSFNINNAISYAETYALDPNDKYISFHNAGGDCTNFASQIIHAGGIPKSYTWKPYSNAWVRVEELYYYLIHNNIGSDITSKKVFTKGSLIQFSAPPRKNFFHTGFITHITTHDAYYCCHSYNKLNYPLSEVYPIIYPKIRCILLN